MTGSRGRGKGRFGAPLLSAVAAIRFKERLRIVRLLFTRGADPNLREPGGQAPLHFAAIQGVNGEPEPDIVAELLEHGDNPSIRDRYGRTPRMLAVNPQYEVSQPVFTALLHAGARANAQDRSGHTALTAAAARGDVGVLRASIHEDADVNARWKDSTSALMLAAR